MEYGSYGFDGFAKIEINNNNSEKDFASTSIHELTHKLLSENTTYGLLTCLLNYIYDSDLTKIDIKKKVKKLIKMLSANMVQVQESISVYVELMYLKESNYNEYKSRLARYRNNYYYYNECKFKNLEPYLEALTEHMIPIMMQVGKAALNIPLDKLDILDEKFKKNSTRNSLQLIPNSRFKKIIRCMEKNLPEITEESIAEIIVESGIEYKEYENKDFQTWATKNILEPLQLLSFEDYMILMSLDDPEQYFVDSLAPYVGEARYEQQYINNINEFQLVNSQNNLIYLYKYLDKNVYGISIDVILGKMYYFMANTLKNIILPNQVIICDRYYYEQIISNFDFIKNHKLFVMLNGVDNFALQFLEKYAQSKKYHFHRINKKNMSVFIQGGDNTYFVHLFTNVQIKKILDLFKDYEYVSLEENSLIDGIFYLTNTDWCIFEDVLCFLIQKKWIEIGSGEHISLGNRIKLTC